MTLDTQVFDREAAFGRTVGWISKNEQDSLRKKHVAIGGTGGTGGYYALTLARMGIENLSLADMDSFEMSNLNRQAGAFLDTFGRNKAEVLSDMVKKANPNIHVRTFTKGVTEDNVDQFLEGADIYVNAMGLSSADIQSRIFSACREKGIPGTSAIVPGFGAAVINFHPDKIAFEFNSINTI